MSIEIIIIFDYITEFTRLLQSYRTYLCMKNTYFIQIILLYFLNVT